MDEPLPNPPAELKAVLPFVQRANELRTADKVIAYWCCYYAAQLGISGNAKETEAKMYLLTLMDTLEDLKTKLADNDAVTNDAASSAYVENFALKVFVGADNEDRAGKATRATAKKFLAASQFIELLKIFGALEPEMGEKIKYAKWKAADIAKAFKEGRKPQAGPPGGDPREEAANVEAAMGPSAVDSKEEQEYLAREMAKLTSAASDEPSIAPSTGQETSRGSTLASDNVRQPPTDVAVETGTLDSASSDAEEMWKTSSKSNDADTLSRSPSAQQQERRDSLDRPQIQPSSSYTSGLGTSPNSRPLPTPPQRDGLPIPPISAHHHMLGSSPGLDQGSAGPGAAPASFWGAAGADGPDAAGATSALPSVPSDLLPSLSGNGGLDGHLAIERIDPPLSPSAPSLPTAPGQLPGTPGAQFGGPSSPFPTTAAPTAPTAPTEPPATRSILSPPAAVPIQQRPAPSAPAIAPPPPAPAVYPETLDAKLSTRVQKLAKGAASAVDFEDLDTARIQLRQALDILEGRTR
ncbi:hypothetical protein PHBOTO_001849 [Pseudozyma hubeiensis]|nr:hypothetical protein PHBOTO_001849 [Pseudozyma hubeiensis]